MITDLVSHIHIYKSLSPNLASAIHWLQNTDLQNLPVGEVAIKEKDIYAIVSAYNTKAMTEGKWEAHLKYIDIQYVISGNEQIGYSPMNEEYMIVKPYQDDKDYALYEVKNGKFFDAAPSNFYIFMPQDVHMPGIEILQKCAVKKLVIKVLKDF
ncbi:MAG: YhcH/YjgK/YiaL family protein [Cytophagales bacterium]|nr:YhcH/YjgK/YiaL family protein [Cytophagales bacterium]